MRIWSMLGRKIIASTTPLTSSWRRLLKKINVDIRSAQRWSRTELTESWPKTYPELDCRRCARFKSDLGLKILWQFASSFCVSYFKTRRRRVKFVNLLIKIAYFHFYWIFGPMYPQQFRLLKARTHKTHPIGTSGSVSPRISHCRMKEAKMITRYARLTYRVLFNEKNA